jgi:ABC-type Mn2+/Zn2+ transport system permease subunit
VIDPSLLEYTFIQRALLAGVVVGFVCPVVGVFVVLRGLAFVGEGIAHAAFTGIALGILLGIPPLGGALLFCGAVSLLIAFVSNRGRIREDVGTGIFFSSSIALGVLLLSRAGRGGGDLMGYLFGSILAISTPDLIVSGVLCVVVVVCVGLFYKELVTVVFDEELASLIGIPSRALTYLLFLLIALTVVACLRIVGIVLVSSLLVTPAATALQFSRDIDRAVVVSALIGVTVTETGLIASFLLDTPPGATVALFSTVLFLVSVGFRQLRNRWGGSKTELGVLR